MSISFDDFIVKNNIDFSSKPYSLQDLRIAVTKAGAQTEDEMRSVVDTLDMVHGLRQRKYAISNTISGIYIAIVMVIILFIIISQVSSMLAIVVAGALVAAAYYMWDKFNWSVIEMQVMPPKKRF